MHHLNQIIDRFSKRKGAIVLATQISLGQEKVRHKLIGL